ncbi:ATP-binding protein [Oerskovia flava]|uniref:ATP-binding protein n=1 Tax=Oerskovia flava TaxID=2986422 RepID=UPI00223FE098|nr:ATP-binding protein [Oerskovia sp. JB1-3-2]
MSAIRSARPPEHFHVVETWVLDTVEELATLRTSLHEALTGTALPPGGSLAATPEKAVLVASELATNALLHARPPTVVQLLTDGDEFIIDVKDHEASAAPVVAEPREPGAGGFGLAVAQRISLDVGWYIEGDAKHVWARFRETEPAAWGSLEPTG